MENEKVSVFDVVTDRIIKALEAGTVPWRQSWDINAGPPRNLVSGKEYQGINWLVSAASAAQKAANMIIGETDSDESVSS